MVLITAYLLQSLSRYLFVSSMLLQDCKDLGVTLHTWNPNSWENRSFCRFSCVYPPHAVGCWKTALPTTGQMWYKMFCLVELEISGKIGNRNTSSKWWRVSFADRNCSAPFSKAIQGVVKVQLVSKGCVMFWGEKLVHALETVLYCPELYIQTPSLHRPVSA